MDSIDIKDILLAVRPNKEGLKKYQNTIYYVKEETEGLYHMHHHSNKQGFWEDKKLFDIAEAV